MNAVYHENNATTINTNKKNTDNKGKTHSSVSALPKIDEEEPLRDTHSETNNNLDIIDDGMSDITAGSDEENEDGNTAITESARNDDIVFYLSNDPRITQRQIHITIEQVEPLSLLIESVAKVTSSEYMLVEAGEDVSDLASLSNKSENSHFSDR